MLQCGVGLVRSSAIDSRIALLCPSHSKALTVREMQQRSLGQHKVWQQAYKSVDRTFGETWSLEKPGVSPV